MQWIAPSEKDLATDTLEKRLWSAANQLWAGAGLKQSDYSEPILGLIFLRFAEVRFMGRRAELEQTSASSRRGSKVDDPASYIEQNVLYLPAGARFAELLKLPEGTAIGKAVNEAMKAIKRDNPHRASRAARPEASPSRVAAAMRVQRVSGNMSGVYHAHSAVSFTLRKILKLALRSG